MTDSFTTRRCTTHRSEQAGWHCPACSKMLCGKCTAKDYTGFYCTLCEGPAKQFTIDRRRKPFDRIVIEAVTHPFRRSVLYVVGLATLLAVTSPFLKPDPETAKQQPCSKPNQALDAVTGELDPNQAPSAETVDPPCQDPGPPELGVLALAVAAARFVLAASLVLLVAGMAARGNKEEPGRLKRILQGMTATFIVWGPGLAYLVFVQRGIPNQSLLQDGLTWLFLLLALLYLPVAIASTAAEVPYIEALSPFHISHWAWQIWPRYFSTIIVLALLFGCEIGVVTSLAARVEHSNLSPLLAAFVVQLAFASVLAMIAALSGSIAYVHGYIFGWGKEESYCDPVFPKMGASGVLKKWAEQRAAIEKRAESNKADGVKAPKEQGEAALVRSIAQAIKTDNLNRALRSYEARPTWSQQAFDDKQLLVLGTTAARQKKFELAERLLSELGLRKTFAAGRARIMLAQIYEENLNRADKANALYQQVIADFPGTDIAKIAERKLLEANSG